LGPKNQENENAHPPKIFSPFHWLPPFNRSFFQVPMNISELAERFWKSPLHYPEKRKATEKFPLRVIWSAHSKGVLMVYDIPNLKNS
jgi:hypothetical protein